MLTGELSTHVEMSGEMYRGVGTTNYNDLENKPTYNEHIIEGDLTSEILGIWQPKNFSTNEQNTGVKWIDGKDIYFKTVITTAINTTGRFITQWGIDNIDSIIAINALYHQSNDRVKVLDGYNGTVQEYGGIIFDITQTAFTVQIGRQILGGNVWCTIFYTKN